MKIYAKYKDIALSSIRPEGWLRKYLEKQRDGLTGHLEVAAGEPFKSGWGRSRADIEFDDGDSCDWWPYEQTGYWIDGMIRCGYLLKDDFLINKALERMNAILDNPDEDGYLGPEFLKEKGHMYRWVHSVFFKAFMALHSATGDERVIPALARHYLSNTSNHSQLREVCNVEAILWTYEKTGDERLLNHAVNAYAEFCQLSPESDCTLENMLSDRVSTEHGVTFNEEAKLGAILYMYTGEEKYLDATVNAYRKIDRDQMLVDGVNSSSEMLRGKDVLDSHETCDITEYAWSMGYLFQATGEAEYADKIERACFNAAPGAVDNHFKALQYFSCPNQVIADKTSNHSLFYRGSDRMSYRPNPGTPCCTGEVNKIMPNFITRMWMDDGYNGLAAILYGPCKVRAEVGVGRKTIEIIEETDYPFRDTINFRINAEMPVQFTLTLRIPIWCKDAEIKVNGTVEGEKPRPGTFVKLDRIYRQGDCVTLTLPMDLKLSHWSGGGIAIERGPLVYSLRIEEDWQRNMEETSSGDDFPIWNLYPTSRWNYALAIDENNLDREVEVIYREMSQEPWDIKSTPLELKVPARTVEGWDIERKSTILKQAWHEKGCPLEIREVEGDFKLTPPLPPVESLSERLGREIEKVTLVPYGCTRLRLTIFPGCTPHEK
jgi:hypothetical protein